MGRSVSKLLGQINNQNFLKFSALPGPLLPIPAAGSPQRL
jgi:hypothetical protein